MKKPQVLAVAGNSPPRNPPGSGGYDAKWWAAVDSNHSMSRGDTLVSCLPIGTLLPNQSGNPDSAEQLGVAIVRPAPFHDQTVP